MADTEQLQGNFEIEQAGELHVPLDWKYFI